MNILFLYLLCGMIYTTALDLDTRRAIFKQTLIKKPFRFDIVHVITTLIWPYLIVSDIIFLLRKK